MGEGPTKLDLSADPELAQALKDAARQSIRVLGLQAKLRGLEYAGDADWSSVEWVEAHSSVARARAILVRLEARVWHERARAFTRRMAALERCRAASTGGSVPAPPPRGNRPLQLGLFGGPVSTAAGEGLDEPPDAADVVRVELPGAAGEVLDELPQDDISDADMLSVEDMPSGWCEACQRERPGVAWCELRCARLCPGCWPAEHLVVARVAA